MIAPARVAAFEALRAVGTGRADLGSALARVRSRLDDERDRALAGEIATGTLRWQGAFDHVIAAFINRPLPRLDPEVLDILRLTMFQLLHLDRIPAAAAVKDAVDLTGKAGKRSAAGLVNAVLRRVIRERDHLPLPSRPSDPRQRATAIAYLSITLSHPAWLVERWLDRHGFEATEAWAMFNNSPAPLTLRANRLRIDRDQLMDRLAAEEILCERGSHAPGALIVRRGNPLLSPMHADGLFVIQDEASQLVGHYAGAQPGDRILDVCASPGGKTLMMAAAAGVDGLVIASDVRGRRIDLLRATVARAGATNVRVVQADAARPLPYGRVFDRVLLDAPCSGLGTIRRDPDIKWRRTVAELPALASAQRAMLGHAADVLKPGGTLVYATCSSEPEENDEVVAAFLQTREDFALADEPLRTLPFAVGLEAFFAARLVSARHLR
jgi:16S rRNA (cytosine967-C5)-methyltransferase